jgi:hypothetical protein
MMFVPINSVITFVADGEFQKFKLQKDSYISTIEEAILEGFEDYREESLCIDGKNVMFPNIKSGYLIIEGRMADKLMEHKIETWYSLKDIDSVLRYGIREGDTINLKGISSLKVTEVDYGNQMLCLSLE